MLDEPFSGIDPIAVDEIKDLLSHIKTMGISILITDHNVRETLKICDKSYLMADGSIFLAGSKEEIISNSLAKEKYLGSSFE